MHAATCMRLPSRPWCLPPQLCVHKHTCSSAPLCPLHVHTRTPAQSEGRHQLKAADDAHDSAVFVSRRAEPESEPKPEPATTPATAPVDALDGAASSPTSDPDPPKPKRVPWNKGRKHLPGTIERIKAGNAAALQRPEVQARIKALAEARTGVSTGRRKPQAPREKKVKVPFEEMTPEQQAAAEAARQRRAERSRQLWQDPAYRAKVAASSAQWRSASIAAPAEQQQQQQQQVKASKPAGVAKRSVADVEQGAGTATRSSKSSSSKSRRGSSKAAAVQVEVLAEDGSPLPLTSSSRKTRPKKPKAAAEEGPADASSSAGTTNSSSSRKKKKADSSTAAGAEDASTAWDVPTVGSGKRSRTPMPSSEAASAASRRRAPSSRVSSEAAAARRRETKALAALHAQLTTSAGRLVQLQQLIGQTSQMLANLDSAAAELVNDRLGTARLQQVAAAARQRMQDAQEQVQELEGLLQLHGAAWDATSGELLEVRHPQLAEQQEQDSSSSSSVLGAQDTSMGMDSSTDANVAYVNRHHVDTGHVVGVVAGSSNGPSHGGMGYAVDMQPGGAPTAAAAADGEHETPLLHAELVSAAVSVETRSQDERKGGGMWL